MLGHTFLNKTKISISCFLDDIDRLRKLKKNSLDGYQAFLGARLVNLNDAYGFLFATSKQKISGSLEI